MRGKTRLVVLCLLIVAVIGIVLWMNSSQGDKVIDSETGTTQVSELAGDDVEVAQDIKDSRENTGPEKKRAKKRDRTQKESAELDQIPTDVEGVFAFGRVVDEVGNPVQGAEVCLTGGTRSGIYFNQKDVSDKKGRFHFDKLKTGPYVLSAVNGDYISFKHQKDMTHFQVKDETTQIGPLLLTMVKGRILNIKVVSDETDEPLEGAQVKARQQGREAITDAQGMVRFPLSQDVWQMEAIAKGYGKVSKHFDLTQTEERTVVLRLPKGGVVFGKVTNLENEPVPEAVVSLNSQGAFQNMAIDSGGLYRWEHVPLKSEFSVFASAKGYRFFNMPKQRFEAGKVEKEVNIALVPVDADTGGPLHGKVTDKDGNPLAGVKLWFSPDLGRSIIETNTVVDGTYRFDEIPILRTDTILVAEAEGYGNKSHSIRNIKSEQVIDFILDKGQYLGGYVYSESGDPLSGVLIGQRNGNFYSDTAGERTDDEGFFRLENLSAPVNLSFSLSGYERTTERIKELNREDFEITLKSKGILLGRVVDEYGVPVTRFTVKMTSGGGYSNPGLYYGIDYDSPQGHFRLENIPLDKEVSIAIHTEKYDTVPFQGLKGVLEKEAVREDFVLNRDGFLVEGVVTHPDGLPIPNITVKYASMMDSRFGSRFSWMSYGFRANNLPESRTDELGRFRFENLSEAEAAFVIVDYEGLARHISDDVMKMDEDTRRQLKLVVAPEGKIDCFINREAYPLASRVMVQRKNSQTDLFMQNINANEEHFTLARLTAGKYTISLKEEMMSMNNLEEQQVEVESGGRSEAHFGFEDVFKVSGLVTLNGETPGVTPLFLFQDQQSLLESKCDANGAFSFDEVKPGKYRLILAKGEIPTGIQLSIFLMNHPNHAGLEVVDKDVHGNWDFQSYIRVTGRINSEQKVHKLTLFEEKGFNTETKSDINGDFIFVDVPPGSYKLNEGGSRNYNLLGDVIVEEESEDIDLGEVPFDKRGQLKLEFNNLPEAYYLQVTFHPGDAPDNQLGRHNTLARRSVPLRMITSAPFFELPEGPIKVKVSASSAIKVDPAISVLNLVPEAQTLKVHLSADTSFFFSVTNGEKMTSVKILHEGTQVTTPLQEVPFHQWRDLNEPYGVFFKHRGRVVGFPEGSYDITATTESGTVKGRITIKLGVEESIDLE